MELVKSSYALVSAMQPPTKFQAMHSALQAGISLHAEAMNLLDKGIRERDASILGQAADLMILGGTQVTDAVQTLEALLADEPGVVRGRTPVELSLTAAPLPTELPVSATTAPSATAACVYAMAYVSDVTIPDDTQMEPGEYFTKTWAVKNTGTCPWDESVELRYVAGDKMARADTAPIPNAQPGDTVQVSVPMAAPDEPGTHRSDWRLCSGDECFEAPVYVRIVTKGAAPAAPPPGAVVVEAWVSDSTPRQNSNVTAYGKITRGGQAIPGVLMSASWYYMSTSPTCNGISGNDGIASCSRDIGRATKDYHVRVVVRFDFEGAIYSASTGFTPQ